MHHVVKPSPKREIDLPSELRIFQPHVERVEQYGNVGKRLKNIRIGLILKTKVEQTVLWSSHSFFKIHLHAFYIMSFMTTILTVI